VEELRDALARQVEALRAARPKPWMLDGLP
jgi:hypothetical protein